MYYYNILFRNLLETDNTILLGPRQTGKTTLVKSVFPEALTFDLLDNELALLLAKRPGVFKEQVQAWLEKKISTVNKGTKFTLC